MLSTDGGDVASRLCALVKGTRLDMSALAERLGVDESELRRSIDANVTRPAFDVLIRAIRYFGVDPAWLLRGEYSAEIHMRCIAADENGRDEELRRLVSQLGEQPLLRVPLDAGQASQPDERIRSADWVMS